MRVRDKILPFLTVVLISSLFAFLSCAHKSDDVAGGDVENMEKEMIGDNAASSSNSAPSSEVPPAAEAPKEEGKQDDLAQLMDEQKPADAPPPEEKKEEPKPEGEKPPEEAKNGENKDELASALDSTSEPPPPSENKAPDAPAPDAPPAALSESSVLDQPPATPEAGSSITKPAGVAGVSRVPRIPTQAIERKGKSLNRYYFVRQGDRPESVSEYVFGTPDHAAEITSLNPGKWAAGKVIYYASKDNPQDTNMKSFYQEKGMNPEEYTVQKGDWLSKVAQQRLGAPGSWKEIAALNGMETPDQLSPGQKLVIYSGDFSKVAQAPKVEPMPETKRAEPPAQTPGPEGGAPQAQNTPPAQQQLPTGEPPKFEAPKPKPGLKIGKGFDIAELVKQNLFAIAIGGMVLLLLLLLASLRKKGGRDDLGEDTIPMTPKIKRK